MTTPQLDIMAAPIAEGMGLYLHIPFCAKKCPYCDFNTYAGLDDQFQPTVDALCREMSRWQHALRDRTIETIFLGGGTPTVLSADQLTQLFAALRQTFQIAPHCEITSEANPGTVDRAKFDCLRALGVNRLSIGVQSFQPAELQFLGRIHTADDVELAVTSARRAGFTNINLDFIFGLPNQALSAWQETLARALALAPEHLSLYSLIVEPNTPLFHWVAEGQVAAPDEDLAAAHYEAAMARLATAGYVQYEVSNWARATTGEMGGRATAKLPTFACAHNLIYWRNQEYLGIGPGAHSHLTLVDSTGQPRAQRWGNHKPVPGYVKRMAQGSSVEAFSETIGPTLAMGETMMLGLRLLGEGVAFDRFQARHATSLRTMFAKELAQLQMWGLLMLDNERVCLTDQGLLLGNQVFARFLPESAAA